MSAAVGVQPCKFPKVCPSKAGAKSLNLKAAGVRVSYRTHLAELLEWDKHDPGLPGLHRPGPAPSQKQQPCGPDLAAREWCLHDDAQCTAELGSCSKGASHEDPQDPPCKCGIPHKFGQLPIRYA